mgnify:FL=1
MKYLVSVEDSIRDILSTPIGSRVMLPEYGSRLFELIDRRINDEFRADLSYFVIEAVQRWEKREQIDEVKLVSFKNHKLSFKIVLTDGKEIGVEL